MQVAEEEQTKQVVEKVVVMVAAVKVKEHLKLEISFKMLFLIWVAVAVEVTS